jgi:hypothetical protein
LIGDFRAFSPSNNTVDFAVLEGGRESRHVELASVLDQGGLLVIFPSAAADSAHQTLIFS